MKTINFAAADEVIITGDRNRTDNANLNQVSGPAFTILDNDGKPIACGGMRIQGVAEAWYQMNQIAEKEHLKYVMRQCKEKLEEMQREEKIFQMYAKNVISENFLEHLGFEKAYNIFTR